MAGEGVAADLQEAFEQPAEVLTEEPRPAELRDGEMLAEEAGPTDEMPPEETASGEAIPAEETTGEEVPVEEARPAEAELETGQEPEPRETVEDIHEEAIKAVEDEDAVVAPPIPGTTLEEDQEPVVEGRKTVFEWDGTSAEIEAKDAGEGEESDKELPAGLFKETDEEDRPRPAEESTVGPENAEPAAESLDVESPSFDKEEIAVVEPMTKLREESPVETVKEEESPDDHFIFEDQKREPEPVQEVEDQPYGLIREQCWQCGKKNRSGVPFAARNGRLYCPECLPAESESAPEVPAFGGPTEGTPRQESAEAASVKTRFTVGRALREAWEKTKGAKGTIWAGSAVMYLTLIVLAAGGAFLLPGFGQESAADADIVAEIANFAFQALIDAVSVLFTAGLLFMGIRKVAGEPINWKMVFTGFSNAGRILVAAILQSLMIFLGFLVLVLPGIYLAIGYSMTLPLIVDRKMSPWQAMETSRKAVHEVWWRVAGLYLTMVLFFFVSLVPFGLGLIWTWPMFIILAGVVYRYLFRFQK